MEQKESGEKKEKGKVEGKTLRKHKNLMD